jgi:tetratricopeptide (TPR) repeat protein
MKWSTRNLIICLVVTFGWFAVRADDKPEKQESGKTNASLLQITSEIARPTVSEVNPNGLTLGTNAATIELRWVSPEVRNAISDAIAHASYAKALKLLKDQLSVDPNNLALLGSQALVYNLAHMYEDSMEVCQRILKEHPTNAFALRNLGDAFAGSGHLDEAVKTYRRGIKAEPDDAFTWSSLSEALARKGDSAGAIQAAEQSIQLKPDEQIFYIEAAGVYALFGNDKAAQNVHKRYDERKKARKVELVPDSRQKVKPRLLALRQLQIDKKVPPLGSLTSLLSGPACARC